MGERGPKTWEPTAAERRMIEHYVAIGYTQEQIGALIGKSVDSLQRHCREELDTGALKVNAKIAGKLYQKAMEGDTASIIFWTKTRLGWTEKSAIEHTGKDGGPIEMEHVIADADAFTRAVARLAARITKASGTGETAT